MIVSHSRRFIFVHVNKAGGSSMQRALSGHLAWNDIILGTTELGQAAKLPFQRAFGLSEHSSLDEIAAVCGPELVRSYFSFALVRHPVDRLVSLYNFVFSRVVSAERATGLDRSQILRMVRDREEDPRLPFLGWHVVRALAGSEGFGGFIRSAEAYRDPAFRSQTDWLHTRDGGLIDMAVRLEDIDVRIPQLSARLGFAVTMPHDHRTPFTALSVGEVAVADRNYLREVRSDEFTAFDYR